MGRKSNKLLQSDTKMRADFRVEFKAIGTHFCAAEQGVIYAKKLFSVRSPDWIAMRNLELKIPPVVQAIIIAIAMWSLSVVVPTTGFSFAVRVWFASLIAITGGVMILLGVVSFRLAQTTMDPRVLNQTTSLVKRGIYQISRNPMYLGFLCILVGWAVYLSNGYAYLLLPVFILYMNRFQIAPEERFMLEKFGEEYRSYLTEVRRWM